ncbi:MAG: cell division initiation protein, partial [Actinomycetota bacterium]|nr:cell division initiation protein [Actinomycetota bacterium]
EREGRSMDLIERIDELQVLIEEAKAVPLSSSAVINRDELLDLLAQLKEQVPDEIRQARWMTRDRDELLERARKEAERIVAEAQEQRGRLLSRTEIVHAAEREAERVIDEAKDRGAKIQHEAEDYVDQKLAAFEILLNKTLATVARGREQLRGEHQTGVVPQSVPAPAQGPFNAAELSEPAV